MSFLLDTNILSAHLRRPGGVAHFFFQYSGQLHTSTVCLAELLVWSNLRSESASISAAISRLFEHEVRTIDFDQACAESFGFTRAKLRRIGIEVDTTDLMIAATALAYDLILVTNNTADFQRIPDLRLENWISS